MAIFSLPRYEYEVFWRYYWRLGDSLGCDHSFEKWEICDVMFESLNEETRKMVESMSNGDFHAQSLDEAWSLFEWLARDTYEWEMSMNANQNLENFSSYEPETCISPPSSFHLDEFANVAHASYELSSSPCINSYDQSYATNDESHMLDYESLPQFDSQNAPPTIVDPLLQLEIDLKLLRTKLGCNDDILEFNDVDSRDVKNENQLGKSSLDLDDGFWSSDGEEYALEEKRPIIEDIVENEDVYKSIHSLFESKVSTSNELDLTLPPCSLECLPSPTIPSCSSEDLGQFESELYLVVGNVFEDLEDGKDVCKESLVEKACDLKTYDIGEVICETLVSIPSPYIPFSKKLDLLPSFPISFPYLSKIPPLNEPPSSLHFQVPHLINFEEESEIATKKRLLRKLCHLFLLFILSLLFLISLFFLLILLVFGIAFLVCTKLHYILCMLFI
ncbi:uncharacterized protein LOC109136351 [Beta vulgaris subsp. vulgaris]|uniref:uncharacterized protein LOC109136351 n=1 Tax=Beta vulgaris subsp. vulgaris TaxID=3555 RepID=UPI002037381E|nr:uncharacterized protein LOC109136351 [Beta vulgaris subsp. vulgaris]XP_019107904.2 uncharacterized protein LOC109136351 [Beta vulgaris subsp. vulgaris]XP_048494852.1 uncharacterized protein LOC109136351 [Beta vulgaris subsp. vulgaris]